ncbi:NSP (nuclear shuttle protein)-interacting GTPase [Actinidia rufa]|uniref:NSP (Nuclear shuttle protein)-interacting GTPase n=1 Tax=Actinidia rufa TaxID=165716 RepID=A0A7J0DX82_9ERIC|nr:NSP (nuclear shuttle protein)-interacting GTPase [Actinidia rufa]
MHLHVIQGEAESTPMKTGEMHIRLGLEAHHVRTHNERRYSHRPSPGGRSEDRDHKNTYDERRSPGYDQESRQYGDYRRSPAHASSQLEGKSPNLQKDLDVSSPPIVQPVKDIWGDNVAPLRIIEPPTLNAGRVTDGSLRTQRTASSSSLASSNGNPAESKREDNKQLQVNRLCSQQLPPTLTAGHVLIPRQCVCTCKPLNNFPPVSAQAGAPVGHTTVSPFGVGAPAAATTNNLTTFPSGGAPAAAPGSATAFPSNRGQ